jgi:hypothetical protein
MGLDIELNLELDLELDFELAVKLVIGLLLLSGGILAETKGPGNRLRVKRGTSTDHQVTVDSSIT